MENVRDWISDNPETFAGICTALLIIAVIIIVAFQIVAYAILVIGVVALSFGFVKMLYTLIFALVEEFLC